MAILQELSNGLASAAETAGQSTVSVSARRRMGASGIVWSADGLIVTAHHVIAHEDRIRVGLPDGATVPAALLGRDPGTDLAVLRAESVGLSVPEWAAPEESKVGHLVLALGRPGQTVQATLGVISALGQGWRTPSGGEVERYVQTDVLMYPGFSGGPLVDVSGRVIGLNTSALLRGVSLTLPASTVRGVVEALLAHGRIRRGYLGVGSQMVRLPEALQNELGQETGVLLVSVEPDSPAGRGGLLLGDTIVGLDGQPVRQLDDLLGLLSGERVGRSVPVRIVRGGQVQEIGVTIGERGS